MLTASFFSGVGDSTFITLSLLLLASGWAEAGCSTFALVFVGESIFSLDSRLYWVLTGESLTLFNSNYWADTGKPSLRSAEPKSALSVALISSV